MSSRRRGARAGALGPGPARYFTRTRLRRSPPAYERSPSTVLVVDDEKNMRFPSRWMLADEGHAVRAVESAEEGPHPPRRENS